MKKIILTVLCTGHSSTKKYTVKDLENYLFILKGLFKQTEYGIGCSDSFFWEAENNNNRFALIRDIQKMKRRDIKDFGYFDIINRCANGDKYGNV